VLRRSGLHQAQLRRVGDSGAGSGGPAPWFSNLATLIRALDPTLTALPLVSECASLSTELGLQGLSGTGTLTINTAKPGGVIRSQSGATAGSYATVQSRNGITEAYIPNLRTAHYALACKAQVIQTAATFLITFATLGDTLTGEMGWKCRQATSGVNYVASVFGTNVDTGIAIDLVTLRTFVIVADGTNVRFFYGPADGSSLIASSVIAQSNAPTNPGIFLGNAQNLGTAASVSYDLDAVMVLTQPGS
jgi:hypothetical protein